MNETTHPATPTEVPPRPANEAACPPEFIEDGSGSLPPAAERVVSSPPASGPLPSGTKKTIRAQQVAQQTAQKNRDRRFYTLVTTVSMLRSLVIVFAVGVVVATIFASFTSNDSLSLQTQQSLAIAYSTQARAEIVPTGLPTPAWFKKIALMRGHSGIAQRGNTKGGIDPGAVCNDEPTLTELSVTTNVGDRITAALRGRGYEVDALDEWDMRLVDPNKPYEAGVFLSIHADSCLNFNDGYNHSGFKVVGPEGRLTVREQDLRLTDCLREHYAKVTGLPHSGWTVTNDMLYYHAFREVSQRTPAAILELGFLYYDRDLLKNKPDKAAQGVVEGLLCFLDPKSLVTPTVAPVPKTAIPPSGTPKR